MVDEAKRPKGRSLAEFQPLKPAEEKLLEACRMGEVCRVSLTRPEEAERTADNVVRAWYLRFLILGGDADAPVHERGVQLRGAWIDGALDLQGTTSTGNIALFLCWLTETPMLLDCHVRGTLTLSGCRVPGLTGDRLMCDGGLFLRKNFRADGTVLLSGAKIGGHLDCEHAVFNGPEDAEGTPGYAFLADSVDVTGSVLLGNTKVHGEVRLVDAKIGGTLDCQNAKIGDGKDTFFYLENASISGRFLLRNMQVPVVNIHLYRAAIGALVDDAEAWGKGLDLQSFVYDSIYWESPNDAKTRLAWLDKQNPGISGKDGDGTRFSPQPWLQLKKVLHEAGHTEQARQVGIALERRRRHCGKIGAYPNSWGLFGLLFYKPLAWAFHKSFGIFTGYGYRPMILLFWMLGVWLAGGAYDYAAAPHNAFAPDGDRVTACPDGTGPTCAIPPTYQAFHPFVYSLNVLLPVVELQQEENWHPVMAQNPSTVFVRNITPLFTTWGGRAQLYFWFETLFGWMSGLLLVAVLSGLTRKQDDG